MTSFTGDLAKESWPGYWNQYKSDHPDYDRPGAHLLRRVHLDDYLARHVRARYALIGLAPGYAGARFSGEPFNDELHFFERTGLRTSTRLHPWREETSLQVQNAITRLGIQEDTVCWNVLPLHPVVATNPLANRTPKTSEVDEYGLPWLSRFLSEFQPGIVIPVGRVAEDALKTLVGRGRTDLRVVPYLRHPSHGGAQLFFRGLHSVVNGVTSAEEVKPRKTG